MFPLFIKVGVSCVFIGKFQMQVLANCGHMVHEDKPDAVCIKRL